MQHPSNKVTLENVDEVVFWHKPNQQQIQDMERIAQASRILMETILLCSPDCADRSTALRCVREARMWANSANVLNPKDEAPIDHERG
jgi:hypothetical protein